MWNRETSATHSPSLLLFACVPCMCMCVHVMSAYLHVRALGCCATDNSSDASSGPQALTQANACTDELASYRSGAPAARHAATMQPSPAIGVI